jgi:hypothetical protein
MLITARLNLFTLHFRVFSISSLCLIASVPVFYHFSVFLQYPILVTSILRLYSETSSLYYLDYNSAVK